MDGTMATEAYVNKPEATHSHKKIDDFELEPVPEKAKRSWWVISLIWLAIGIDISGLFLGSILSSGIGFEDALLATFIGQAYWRSSRCCVPTLAFKLACLPR